MMSETFRSKHGRFVSKKKYTHVSKVAKLMVNSRQLPGNAGAETVEKVRQISDTNTDGSVLEKINTDDSVLAEITSGMTYNSTTESTPSKETQNTNLNNTSTPKWNCGRRIVELGHLAKQMMCVDCGQLLYLSNIVDETRHGFGSILYIHCTCGLLNSVTTNKSHRIYSYGPPVFDVNTKAALGMLHSGTGLNQIENFMSTIEVQGLTKTVMKKRESEVGTHISAVAQETCREALEEEIQMSRTSLQNDENIPPNNNPVSGVFKYDMGWQKRGSGRCYDSKSGIGTMIGNNTGKVCAYGMRSKDCRMCTFHINKGEIPPSHSCAKNWDGSSKAMEPDVGGKLVEEIESKDIQVGVIIMDDDCTTMARIKNKVSHPVIKWSDLNHTKKHLGNSLYNLQKKHKCLSTKVIMWLQKCFSYAVAQNKGNVEGFKKSVQQIVPHAFGDHELCDKTWCGYHANPETYKHKSLPYGRNLSGEELKNDLSNVFEVFVKNGDKIAPAGSTKEVESFNNMIAAKAPKKCHYSASFSLQNRLNCAVAQKNSGFSYINRVNRAIGVSPGRIYAKLAASRDKKRRKRLQFERTKEFKKRKIEAKLNRRSKSCQNELREGVTYKTAVAITHISDISVNEIPATVVAPVKVRIEEDRLYNNIYIDLETTSLHKTCDIIQIAAVCQQDSFNHYILPTQPISHGASEVTCLTMHGNVMFNKGKPVNTVFLKEGLQLLLACLQGRQPCLLVGHNFQRFDCPRLIRAFELSGLLTHLKECVTGIVDTLPLIKDINPNLESYKQENLVKQYLQEDYAAHNALADVEILQRLTETLNPVNQKMLDHSCTINSAVECYMHTKLCDKNTISLDILITEKVLSKDMAKKVASSDLCLAHLNLAISRGGLDGLTQLFKEKLPTGKPRVTNTKRVIKSVYDYLSKKINE